MTRCALGILALVMTLPLAVVAQQPATPSVPPPQGTATIAGRVVAGDTGKPVSGVVLSLMSWEVMRVPKSATTDAAGRFEFAGLVAGSYLLTSRPERYLWTNYGQTMSPDQGRPIVVRDGERFDRADISLIRPGAIEGRVIDEFGDPAPNISVQAYRIEFAAGARRLMPAGGRNSPIRPTDDKGQFRIFGLAPGTYYVCALSGAFADPNATGGFAPTFFPGTTDVSKIRGVAVTPGNDSAGITIPLVPARMGHVAGTLVDASGRTVQQGSVLLAIQDRTGASPITARGPVGRDGGFTFRNVPAGAYTLQAYGAPSPGASGGMSQLPFGYHSFSTTGDDVDGLRLVVKPGVTAKGRVVFEGDDVALPKPTQVQVFPRPVEFESAGIVGGGPPRFLMHDDWTFEVGDMTGWRVVRVDIQSPAWSLSRVTLDGIDVTDKPLDFRTRDVEDLEIQLTSRGASIRGVVLSAAGQPVRDYAVVVFADDRERWTFPSRFVVLARPNQDGKFEARGLPPERYLAIAVPAVQGFEWQDPDFLERLRPDATLSVLAEAEARAVELRLRVPGKVR